MPPSNNILSKDDFIHPTICAPFSRFLRYVFLNDEKQKLQLEGAGRDDTKNRISDISICLMDRSTSLTEYDEALVRRLIEKKHGR